MGNHPNTYTVTKNMAENLLVKHYSHMPMSIVRPSIICGAWKEPMPGWYDVLAATGMLFLYAGLGLLKILPIKGRNIADNIPVDFVVNHMIVAAFKAAQECTNNNKGKY